MEALSSPRADCVSTVPSGTQGSRLANPNDPSAAVVRVRLLSSEDDLIAGAVIGHELTVPSIPADPGCWSAVSTASALGLHPR